ADWGSAPRIIDHGRAVAEALGRKRPPQLLAGGFVEGDDCAFFAADHADQPFAVEQRMGSVAPNRRLGLVFLRQIMGPKNLARFGIEAKQISFRSQRVDLAALDQRRGARAERVRDGIRAVVLVFPEQLAVRFVKTQHAFSAWDRLLLASGEALLRILDSFGQDTIHDVNAPLGNSRPGVPGAHGGTPADLRTTRGKLFEDTGLSPDGIAPCAQPLRPIVAA